MSTVLQYEPLLYAASDESADLFYFTRFWAPDPFLAFGCRGKKIALFNALERERAKKEAQVGVILALEDFLSKDKTKTVWERYALLIQQMQSDYQIPGFYVPEDFPFALGQALEKLSVPIAVRSAPFFKEQMVKTLNEIELLKEANQIAAAGLAKAQSVILASQVDPVSQVLTFEDTILTSERLRFVIELECLRLGAKTDCIAAGGLQACDPHQVGSGALKAGELIIVDVFPRVKKTGYYGDMTRTFLKGQSTLLQSQLIDAVTTAKAKAVELLKPGVQASSVHRVVEACFKSLGYATVVNDHQTEGFIHSTGHGVGLGLHEPIRISAQSETRLEPGMVVTIEPGLYYPSIGGVRIEDVYVITETGAECLSHFSYDWQIN